MGASLFIFDLDGTLVDSTDDLALAVNLMRRDFGLSPLSRETVAGYVGEGVRVLVDRALSDAPHVDREAALALQHRHYAAHLTDHTRPYPGVREGLEALRAAGHVLAVATNKPMEMAERLLKGLRMWDSFAVVLGGGVLSHLKPHPAVVEEILRRTGIGRDRAWMVGDHWTDLETARGAGLRSIFFRYGIGQQGEHRPDRVFDTFSDFVQQVLQERL